MTHLAWVPPEWQEAAVETLAGLGDRHPSRGVLLFPEESASRRDRREGLGARLPALGISRTHIAAEVIELHLRGSTRAAPASIVMPLLVTGLPVFLRWRGRPPFGEQNVEQLVDLCDRLVVDSGSGPTCPRPTVSFHSTALRAPTSPGDAPSRGAGRWPRSGRRSQRRAS